MRCSAPSSLAGSGGAGLVLQTLQGADDLGAQGQACWDEVVDNELNGTVDIHSGGPGGEEVGRLAERSDGLQKGASEGSIGGA